VVGLGVADDREEQEPVGAARQIVVRHLTRRVIAAPGDGAMLLLSAGS
jgi:hypothetical protein